jgi:uncharacterized DUF497 family protein
MEGARLARHERLPSWSDSKNFGRLKHAHFEDRLIAVGRTARGRPLFVVITIRERFGQPTIRPVSARYMHEREAKNYEAQGSKNDH